MTSSDRVFFPIVGGKKIKIKIGLFPAVGRKKEVGGKNIKITGNSVFFFKSPMIWPYRRSSSSVGYNFSGLILNKHIQRRKKRKLVGHGEVYFLRQRCIRGYDELHCPPPPWISLFTKFMGTSYIHPQDFKWNIALNIHRTYTMSTAIKQLE